MVKNFHKKLKLSIRRVDMYEYILNNKALNVKSVYTYVKMFFSMEDNKYFKPLW